MPVYIYRARNQKGKIIEGEISARDEQELKRRLLSQKLILVSVREKRAPVGKGFLFFGRVSEQSLTIFSRQLATMIGAGLSLIRSLDILAEQTEDNTLRNVLKEVKHDVESGKSLSAALSRHKHVFSDLYISMVRAGEIGGMLDEVLDRLATFLEKDFQLKKRVKSAMTYPAVIMVLAILIVMFLVTYVLPTFIELFKDLDVKLPLMTQILIKITEAARNPMVIATVFVFGILMYAIYSLWVRTDVGRRSVDRFKLVVPIFGDLAKKVAISRFARTLGTLLASGVSLMAALEIVGEVAGNMVIKEAIDEVRMRLREGENLSGPLNETGIFPPMVTQMIAVGEETGNLDTMLTKIADFYDTEVEYMLSSLTSMLEPIMIVMMGGIVGFIVIAIFMPLYTLISEMSR